MKCFALHSTILFTKKTSNSFISNSPNTLVHLNLHEVGEYEAQVLAIMAGEALPKTVKSLGVCFVFSPLVSTQVLKGILLEGTNKNSDVCSY